MSQPRFTREDFAAVLVEIGVEPRVDVARDGTFEAAEKVLGEFKAKVKKAYVRRLFEVHPDRNPDDPEAEEKCKVLNAMRPYFMSALDSVKVMRQPQRQIVHRVVHQRWHGTTATSTATNASTVTWRTRGPGWTSTGS